MPWRRQTFDDLPALSVRGKSLRRSLRISTIAWMYGVVWMAFTGGAHVNQFVRMLGFNNVAFGMLAAIPFAATFGQSIAAVLVESSGLRKYQFIYFGTLHRLLWLVPAVIPLLIPLPSTWAVVIMLAALWFSSFLNALATPAYLTWMADLVPRRIRGRFFAMRTSVSRGVQIVSILALGATLDAITRNGAPMTAADQPLLLYATCGVFALAAVLGATDILLFRKIREVLPSDRVRHPAVIIDFPPPLRRTIPAMLAYWMECFTEGVWQLLVTPMKDRVFRHFVLYGITITFGMSVAGPFFMRNVLENLGFTQFTANLVYMAAGPVSGIIGLRAWGKMLDRWGRRPVLIIATAVVVFSVMPNFLAAPQTPSPAFVSDAANWTSRHIGAIFGHPEWRLCAKGAPVGGFLVILSSVLIGGAGWAGVMLAQNNVVLAFSDRPAGSKYVAAAAVLMSVGGVIGGVVGGIVADALSYYQTHPIILGPFLWNNWHATFFLSMLGRLGAIFWLINMPDPGARSVRGVLQNMFGSAYTSLAGLFSPLRFLLSRSRDQDDRPGPV